MLILVADENFNGVILRGLFRRKPTLDVVRIQDVGLLGADDPTILSWTAMQRRILLTHDRATVPDFAHERVKAGLPMPGVFVASDRLAIGRAIEDHLLLAAGSERVEWDGQVLYLPL